MSYPVVYSKNFNGRVRDLAKQGHMKIVQAVRAAIGEAGMSGEIKGLPRTKHGEGRLPNVEKYDLPDAYRLVVQLVDGVAHLRAFLFVGTHDDAERWLDAHRNYRWVKSPGDGTLQFVQVTVEKAERYVPADRLRLDAQEELLSLPLLRILSEEQWKKLSLPVDAETVVKGVTAEDYERDADGVVLRVDELAGWDLANLMSDLLAHAYEEEWDELHRRIDVHSGKAMIAAEDEVGPAMKAPENSESFITFEDHADIAAFFEKNSLADWMLFLHPEQKRVSNRDFRGPARLRGVSGSGKTSVLVHRARYLAKKYKAPVLLVTLTESLRKLINRLVDDLCGPEAALIATMTMSGLAKQVLERAHPRGLGFFSSLKDERAARLSEEAVEAVRGHADFTKSGLASLDASSLREFMRDEFSYVRTRLPAEELETYLDVKLFPRTGRGRSLGEPGRRAVLAGIREFSGALSAQHVLDNEGVVSAAFSVADNFAFYRSALCDEVQDLSHLEVALLARIKTPGGEPLAQAENGLFLAGDGAQSIYRRGFTLRRMGVDVGGRSFSLKKNYRNTFEILQAAFGLVAEYEFADVDEEDIGRPAAPDFANRHGSRPLLMKCTSPADEADAIAAMIKSHVRMGQIPGQICVIAPSQLLRDLVGESLSRGRIDFVDLRADADFESDHVKISTIESAKGHEFSVVFVMGLVEGVLPLGDDIAREAARLYVAMTRARDNLVISYSPWTNYPASRFLVAIQDNCDEARIRDGEMRRI